MGAELDFAKTWFTARQVDGPKAFAAIQGAFELAEKVRAQLLSTDRSLLPSRSVYGLMHGDVVVARQIADAVGLATIAGRRGLDADDVLGALRVLCAIGEVVFTVL